MIYDSPDAFLAAPHKRVVLFGMSGLGKTWAANLLRARGDWFHYSVDYRIGTRYLGEAITDNAIAHAVTVPFLREMLLSDSIAITNNIGFNNLAPLSAFLGKPGDTALGGLPIAEYRARQRLHEAGEKAAMLDTGHFIDRAQRLYGYPHFVCDTSGSVCEVVDPDDPEDPILTALTGQLLLVRIAHDEGHVEELNRRFDAAPKPMCYRPDFLDAAWDAYLAEFNVAPDKVDPDVFVRWTYARALAHREPLYDGMARWGVTISAASIESATTAEAIEAVIARALEAKPAKA